MDFGPLGWVRDDVAVEAVCVAIEAGEFGAARPASFGAARPDLKGYWQRINRKGVSGIFLADAELKLFGEYQPPEYQQRGTCVSRGTFRAVQESWYNQLVAKHEIGRPVKLCFEPIYAGSRVNIGKGRLGTGDGSVGAWAARFVNEFGVLERGIYGAIDLTKPREDWAVAWGNPGKGCPEELLKHSASHKVVVHLCQTVEDIADAIAAKFGVAVCQNGLYGPRDQSGMSRLVSEGAHCTLYDAVFHKNGHLCFGQQQSWGPNNPKGPDVLEYDGGSRKLRSGEFGCYASDLAPLLRSGGEAWAFDISGDQGWKPSA